MLPLCRNAVKGMDALLASGTIASSAPAIAEFLREHKDVLDTMQIGEYFGHHEEQAVSFFLASSQRIPACHSKRHANLSFL